MTEPNFERRRATNETARLDLETELELTRMKVQMILAQRSKIDAATRDL